MKRTKTEPQVSRRFKLPHLLLGLAALYLLFIAFKFPQYLESSSALSNEDTYIDLDGARVSESEDSDFNKPFFGSVYKDTFHRKLEDNQILDAPIRPSKEPLEEEEDGKNGPAVPIKPLQHKYGRITGEIMRRRNRTVGLSVLEKMADEAWTLGLKAWGDLGRSDGRDSPESSTIPDSKSESCPSWLSLSGDELASGDRLMFLPCGLAAGSSITVVGTPHQPHKEYIPQLAKLRNGNAMVMVSQFMIELQGLKAVDGEDPPKIMHLNPRLKGDWSQRPIIEHNTCYRMQWGSAQRCDGLPSKSDDDMLGMFDPCCLRVILR